MAEIVLLIFLPALLHWEALKTSLREIRANLRAVIVDSLCQRTRPSAK